MAVRQRVSRALMAAVCGGFFVAVPVVVAAPASACPIGHLADPITGQCFVANSGVPTRRRNSVYPRQVAGHLPGHPAEPVTPRRRSPGRRPLAVAPQLVEDRHRAGPPRRGGVHLHREAGHFEPVGGQRLQVVQLLDVGVADGASGAVAFPDDRRVVVLGVALRGVGERRVPAPGVGAGEPHAPLQQVQGGVPAHPAARPDVVRLAVAGAGAGVHQHDLQRRQRVADALELLLDVGGRHHVAVGEVPEVELHRGLQAPFQRHLVDGDGALAAVHRRRVVVGRVEVSAVVGGDPHPLDRPAFSVGQVVDGRAGKNDTTSAAVCLWS